MAVNVICAKKLRETDVNHCLEWPEDSFVHLPNYNRNRHVEFQVVDNEANNWSFACSTRGGGSYPRPVLRGDWLSFVKTKGLCPGDMVVFYAHGDPTRPPFSVKVIPKEPHRAPMSDQPVHVPANSSSSNNSSCSFRLTKAWGKSIRVFGCEGPTLSK